MWGSAAGPLVAIALIGVAVLWLIDNWDKATAAVERFITAYREIPVLGGLQRFGADTAGFIQDQIVAPIRDATSGFGVGGTGFDLTTGRFVPLVNNEKKIVDPIRNALTNNENGRLGYRGLLDPGPRSSASYVQEDNRTFTIAEGAVVVYAAEGQSEREIGQNVGIALGDQLESLASSFDSEIAR